MLINDESVQAILEHAYSFPQSELIGVFLDCVKGSENISNVIPISHSPLLRPMTVIVSNYILDFCEAKEKFISGIYFISARNKTLVKNKNTQFLEELCTLLNIKEDLVFQVSLESTISNQININLRSVFSETKIVIQKKYDKTLLIENSKIKDVEDLLVR